jgi:hypothetical protein
MTCWNPGQLALNLKSFHEKSQFERIVHFFVLNCQGSCALFQSRIKYSKLLETPSNAITVRPTPLQVPAFWALLKEAGGRPQVGIAWTWFSSGEFAPP